MEELAPICRKCRHLRFYYNWIMWGNVPMGNMADFSCAKGLDEKDPAFMTKARKRCKEYDAGEVQ